VKYPWISWYPGEYLNKTRHLTMSQHGAYLLLLWEYYINGPFPTDVQRAFNVCSAHSEEEQKSVTHVLREFFVKKHGKYRHLRADEEIERRATIRQQASKAGKVSATKRQRPLNGRSTDVEQPNQPKTNYSQSHNTITPPTPLSGGLSNRQIKSITNEMQKIAAAMVGANYSLEEALAKACGKVGVEFEKAKYLLGEQA